MKKELREYFTRNKQRGILDYENEGAEMNGPNNPIKWCDYTTNPVKGLCPLAKKHPWCYAARLYDINGMKQSG